MRKQFYFFLALLVLIGLLPLQAQLIQHLDASVEGSIIRDSSNNAIEWLDQSGNENNAIPVNGFAQYSPLRTFPNGLKGIDVSGSRISLQLLSAADSDTILNQAGNPRGFCIVAVVYIDSILDTWNDLIGNSSAVRTGFFMRYSSSASSVANLGSSVKVGTKEIIPGQAVIFSFNYDAGKSEFHYWCSANQEGLSGSIAPEDFSNDSPITMGSITNANRYFEGMIGEVLVFDTTLTSETHEELISGLKEKWGNDSSTSKTSETYTYTGISGDSHDIEVHFPDQELYPGERPCVVFFHGGGWSSGDLAQFRTMCKYFASRGMVSMTANYSMHTTETLEALPPDESRKTICVIDGKSVIRWAKENAESLMIDTSRIVAGGASAGGHISVLSMMDEEHNNPADSLEVNTNVKAFLLFCPAFTLPEKDNIPEVNVFRHVNKTFPPTLFMVGETDGWEAASYTLADKLTNNESVLEYWMAYGEGHMFHREDNWADVTTKKADEFLVSIGVLGGESDITDPPTGEELVLINVESAIGIMEYELNKQLIFYPNPAIDYIQISNMSGQLNYRVIDYMGNSIMMGVLNNGKLDITPLEEGMYLLQIEGYQSAKVIK